MACYGRAVGVLLCCLAACESSDSSSDGPTSAEAAVYEIEWDYGPGLFHVPDTTVGLADLSSYTATLTLDFDGTNGGEPEQWSSTYVMVATGAPSRQLTVESTGAAADSDAVYRAELEGLAFERVGTSACTTTLLDPDNRLADRWEPAGFLTGVLGAEEAGDETVNGVAAGHYTFDERAFGPEAPHDSTGDLWLAADGGYLVRYEVITEAEEDYFGDGIEGTLTWDYQVSDVDQPLTVVRPGDCPEAPA